VELLLGCGAETQGVDADGRTPLQLAARYDWRKCLDLLLLAGADPNFATEEDGCTALHLAAVNGNVEAVEVLMTRGATNKFRDHSGHTAGQLLLEHQEQMAKKQTQVLHMLQEDDARFYEQGGTQTESSLMDGMAGMAEVRAQVEVAEVKGDISDIKSEMLMLRRQVMNRLTARTRLAVRCYERAASDPIALLPRRQMSAMVEQVGGAATAIDHLAAHSEQSTAAVVRLVPPPGRASSLDGTLGDPPSASYSAGDGGCVSRVGGRPWSAESTASTVFTYASRPGSAQQAGDDKFSRPGSALSVASHRPTSASSFADASTPIRGVLRPGSASHAASSPSALALALPNQYAAATTQPARRPMSAGPGVSFSRQLERPVLPARPPTAGPSPARASYRHEPQESLLDVSALQFSQLASPSIPASPADGYPTDRGPGVGSGVVGRGHVSLLTNDSGVGGAPPARTTNAHEPSFVRDQASALEESAAGDDSYGGDDGYGGIAGELHKLEQQLATVDASMDASMVTHAAPEAAPVPGSEFGELPPTQTSYTPAYAPQRAGSDTESADADADEVRLSRIVTLHSCASAPYQIR
jgi:hypothetical protein